MKKFLQTLIAPTIVALLVASAANGAIWEWSRTASSNGSSDASINFLEGQAPSSVNDSARALMARVADWRDDNSGLHATAGTSTAYTLTTFQGLTTTPTNGQLIAFTPHTTNGASATLAADGGTAFAIQTAPGTAVSPGVLVSGTPYTAKFLTASSAWILRNYYGAPTVVPLGTVLDYTGTTAPNSSFVLANGQAISRTTYAAYFALVGTAFGVGDGVATFNVPDLSNRVVAGTQMTGTARITVAGGNFDGNTLGTAGGSQNHTLTVAQLPSVTPAGTNSAPTFTGAGTTITATGTVNVSDTRTWLSDNALYPFSGAGPGGLGAGAVVGLAAQQAVSVNGGSISAGFTGNAVAHTPAGSVSAPTFTGTAFGGGTSHPIVQPTMVLTKIVRVL